MDAVTGAFIGAIVGALASISTSFLTQRMIAQAAQADWERKNRAEIYSQCARHLASLMRYRVLIKVDDIGQPLNGLDSKTMSIFLDHYVEAQRWLALLLIYSPELSRRSNFSDRYRKFSEVVPGSDQDFGDNKYFEVEVMIIASALYAIMTEALTNQVRGEVFDHDD